MTKMKASILMLAFFVFKIKLLSSYKTNHLFIFVV